MKRKELIKKSRQLGYGMLIALTLLVVCIPIDIFTGNYVSAINCVLWIYVGIRMFVSHEKATEIADTSTEIIEVQSKLIEVLRQIIEELAAKQHKTNEEEQQIIYRESFSEINSPSTPILQ